MLYVHTSIYYQPDLLRTGYDYSLMETSVGKLEMLNDFDLKIMVNFGFGSNIPF